VLAGVKELNIGNPLQVLVDVGYSVSMDDIAVDISSVFDRKEGGVVHVGDLHLEGIMASGFLAQNLRNGNFNVLRHCLTLRPDVWKTLIFLLKQAPPDEETMSAFILKCGDIFQLRLLVAIAGDVGLDGCTEAICNKLLVFSSMQSDFWQYQYQVTTFNDRVKRALSMLSPKVIPIIERYLERSIEAKTWKAKRVLEAALKHQKRKQVTKNRANMGNVRLIMLYSFT